MSPFVQEIRSSVEDRLRQLEEERKQLEGILAVLDSPDASPADLALITGSASAVGGPSSSVPPPQRRQLRSARRGKDGRAPLGHNKQRIITLVREQPGITGSEVADHLEIKHSTAFATISRMKRQGELESYGVGLRVPGSAA